MGQVRKPRGNLLQRRRKLPGKQHNGHHSPHAHAPAHDQPSANEVDADIGHGVGEFDQRLHDRAGKVGLGHGLAQLLVYDGVLLRRVFFQIVGFGCCEVGEALLHDLRQLSGFFEPLVVVFPAGARDFRGDPQGDRGQYDDKAGQHPVLQKHGDGDHGDLENALHHHVKHLMDVVAHGAHIVDHAVQYVTHRGLIDVFHRKTPDFVGNGNSQVTGKVTAHRPVHQLHIQIAEHALRRVHRCQQKKPADKAVPDGCLPVAQSEIIELLYQVSQNFRRGNGAQHRENSQHRTDRDPSGNALCLPDDPPCGLVQQFILFTHSGSLPSGTHRFPGTPRTVPTAGRGCRCPPARRRP